MHSFKVLAFYARISFLYARARSWYFANFAVLRGIFVALWSLFRFLRLIVSCTIVDFFFLRVRFS